MSHRYDARDPLQGYVLWRLSGDWQPVSWGARDTADAAWTLRQAGLVERRRIDPAPRKGPQWEYRLTETGQAARDALSK